MKAFDAEFVSRRDWHLDTQAFAHAQSVILFGSRAADCASSTSDWDFLCVGEGSSRFAQGIDVLWIASNRTHDPHWLGSELANHIARWGIVLVGDAPWLSLARPGEQAIDRKRRLIQAQVEGMSRVWRLLATPYRVKQRRNLRRDLQRLERLCLGESVPPAPMLDRDWHLEPRKRDRWQELADASLIMTKRLETIIESCSGSIVTRVNETDS